MPHVAKFGGNVRFYESTRTPLEAIKTDSRHKAATSRTSAHKRGMQTMKIRIYETDFEGNPVECTGEYFSGRTALDIVNAMKMNPFQASLTPLEFMRWMLASIGQEKFALPDDEGKTALLFLQRLTTLGYATFELDANEVDLEHPIPPMQGNLKKQVFPAE